MLIGRIYIGTSYAQTRMIARVIMHINLRQISSEERETWMKQKHMISEKSPDEMKRHCGMEGYDDLYMVHSYTFCL